MDTAQHLDQLLRQTAALAEAICAGDRAATVPTCPDWTLTDLATHVGQAHRWTAIMLAERSDHHLPLPDVTVPASDAETSTWLIEGAAGVVEALRACGEDTPVAGFADLVPARFWGRRMAHETLVHRFDAELTADVPPWPDVEPALAADALDEGFWLLATFGPAHRPGLAGQGETIHVHLTDVDGEWVVTREPTGPRIDRVHRKADVAVRGPATAVLATMTNRREPDEAGVEVIGDAGALADWRRAAAI